jgi:hypothetical protein
MLHLLPPFSQRASHHVFVKIPRQVQLAEVGPRFDMKRALFPFASLFFIQFFFSNQRMRSGKVLSSSRKPSGSGSLRIMHARRKRGAYCRVLALTPARANIRTAAKRLSGEACACEAAPAIPATAYLLSIWMRILPPPWKSWCEQCLGHSEPSIFHVTQLYNGHIWSYLLYLNLQLGYAPALRSFQKVNGTSQWHVAHHASQPSRGLSALTALRNQHRRF